MQFLNKSLKRLDAIRRGFNTQDQIFIFIALFCIINLTVIIPLAGIVFYSFYEDFPVQQEFVFTLDNYYQFTENRDLMLQITIDTLIFGVGSVTLSVVIGILCALIVERYLDSTFFRVWILLPYGIPTVALLVGWVSLLGGNGLITNAVMSLFGLSDPPWNLYSMAGMIFVEGLNAAPLAFILLVPAIRSIPAAVDEAGLSAGASRLTILRKIILPLIVPSILSVSLFLLARSMAIVTTPAILGVPARIYTFGSAIPYLFLRGRLNYALALTFAVYIIIFSAILMYIYYRSISRAEKYAVVTGKGGAEPIQYEVSKWKKYLMTSFLSGYLILAGFMPFIAIIWGSIVPGFDFTLDYTRFTLEHYIVLVTGEADGVGHFWRATRNTIILGIIIPTFSILCAILISYTNQGTSIPFGGLFAYLASVPLAVPSIALALGFLVMFIRTPLYGTIVLLGIAFMGRGIPIAMRYSSPALVKIGAENIEAATITGYRELRILRKIIFPLTSKEIVAGFMHVYIVVVRNVPIAILFYVAGSEVLAIELLFTLENGYLKVASAMAVFITLLCVIPYMLLQYWKLKEFGVTSRSN